MKKVSRSRTRFALKLSSLSAAWERVLSWKICAQRALKKRERNSAFLVILHIFAHTQIPKILRESHFMIFIWIYICALILINEMSARPFFFIMAHKWTICTWCCLKIFNEKKLTIWHLKFMKWSPHYFCAEGMQRLARDSTEKKVHSTQSNSSSIGVNCENNNTRENFCAYTTETGQMSSNGEWRVLSPKESHELARWK